MGQYTSCHSIEQGLVFNGVNLLTFCSLARPPEDGGGEPVYRSDYNGEKIDWEDFFEYRNHLRKIIKENGSIPECKDCMFLREQNWGGEKKLSYILLTNWIECNSDCIYCPMPDPKRNKKYNIVPIIKDIIKNNIMSEDGTIEYAGGEPTMYKYFDESLNLLINNNFKRIVINTNAIKFSPKILKGIKNGLIEMVVSMDAGTQEIHEKVKRVKSFQKIWDNLSKYASVQDKNSKNKLRTKFIIVPGLNDDKNEISLWLEKTKSININSVALNVDLNWIFNNSNNIEGMKKILALTDFFIQKSNELELEWIIYPNIKDIVVRYNASPQVELYSPVFSL